MNTEPVTEARLAARAVALQENIPKSERRELLEMLGLLNDGAIVEPRPGAPEPVAVIEVNGSIKGTSQYVPSDDMRKPMRDRSHLPSGLRNIPGLEAAS
jgi:hypothetical protein